MGALPNFPQLAMNRRWNRLPRTWEEVHAIALGKPDPFAGYGIPCPFPPLAMKGL